MIKRIVKLTFQKDKVDEFKSIFESNWKQIKNFKGCSHVELLQDQADPCVFFTFSLWENEKCIEDYRNSALFNSVWSSVKILFSDKPMAWSVKEVLN